MKPAKRASPSSKKYPPGSFMYKVRKRRIIETLAAFIGGGWLTWEAVHWILVEHYHFPEKLLDITLVTIIGAMLCTLTWRWFGRTKKKTRGIKLELILIPLFILITAYLDVRFIQQLGEPEYADTGAMNSIAVLPFVNMSPEEGQEYFCDGLTEQLITALSNIKELKVVARTSVFSFKGKEMDVRDIGNQLNVETVLEGSVRKSGDTLRVTAQLIKVEDGYHLWSEQFDRKMDDVFAIQDEVTLAIVDKLKLDLLSDERPKIVKRYTENIDAYNLYLMGRYYWNKRTGEGLRKGLDQFQQAIEKDPTYALAYAGVADSYNLLGYYYHMPSKEALPKAKTAAERALEIDESLAEAHTSLAWVSMIYDWDWTAAEKEYKRAIELNPNYATAHHWYSFYLMIMGRRDESIDEARLAVAIDPLSLQINNHMASMLYFAGQYTQAIEEFKRIIEMNHSYVLAHNELGLTYVELKMYDKALEEYQKVIELLGTRTPSIIADLGYLYAVTGRTNEAKKMLEELQGLSEKMYVSPWGFAVIHMGLGQIDQAYEWLEKAYKERDHSMIVFKILSYFEDFRSMPRFKALLQKAGF